MTDLFILAVLFLFVIYGLKAPYIATMGYIWVDTIKPQGLAYGFMAGQPLSMLMAILCITSFTIHFKQKVPQHSKGILTLLIIFTIWVTITTIFSMFPHMAWIKWEDSIKMLIFSMLIPLYIKNKSQLEAIMITFLVSMSVFVLAVGVKTIFGGGGYGVVLIPGTSSVLRESSTFAAFTVMVIPFYVFLSKHSIIFAAVPYKRLMMIAAVSLAVLANIGSSARTGLLGLAILAVKIFIESKKKFRMLVVTAIIAIISMQYVGDSWLKRMDTMNNVESESSAMGRIVVWKWTWDFVKKHPMGGGFWCFIANKGELNAYTDNSSMGFNKAKAFHSIYFGVLGEHGYFGLFLYLLIIYLTLKRLKTIKKQTEDDWVKDAASMLNITIVVFLVCGAFISIAFQPTLYLFIAYTIALYNLHHNNMQLGSKNES